MTASDRIHLRRAERQAEGYLELGMPQHALDTLKRLGNPAGFGVHALYLWGEALRTLRQYDEALVPLKQAAKVAADQIQIWLAMGWCYKRTGRIGLAIEALQQALLVDPTEALIHYNLACYLSLAGRKRRALKHLSRALSINPRYRELVDGETDFDPLRRDPEFQALTSIIA